ncbi:PQQ-dependent sugar dehydrogenase [Microbispora sp. ATCC PTA-5024]|uniref:PQQ-dependent sugar dehydrogenase n=1 Tax=Microbispora sp. ATCC PTA-5024 TaxID=316330 RepID=UPI0003F887A2|nr:PQQ-dependent sugar dehydrogenase [Microbispora sp. ATCC PTA-5024]
MRSGRPAARAVVVAAALLGGLLGVAGPAAAATTYQAEDATISQGTAAHNHSGYTGSGFVDYVNTTGSYVQFAVSANGAGTHGLTFRYANGTTVARPVDVVVNGTVVTTLVFSGTGSWDTWQTLSVNASLKSGANTVRAIATSANGGPNLDSLVVGDPADTARPSTPGQPSCSSVGSTSLTLNWGASTDDVGVAAYDIYDDGNKIAEAGNVTTARLTGLTPNTEYRLSVFARDAAGNVSPPSAQAICTTMRSADTKAPTAPSNLAYSGLTAGSVTLKWTASTDDTGVTEYRVRSGTTDYATVTGAPPGTSATVTGLACGSPYSLHVVARDAAGNESAASNTVTFTTPSCGSSDGGVPSAITQISSGWTIPWGMAWLPDGKTALVTERDDKVVSGQFRVYKVSLSGARTLVGTVPNGVTTGTDAGEGGLMGVAVDPNWSTNHHVYFMHSASEGNRIVRMTFDGTSLSGYTVLVQGIRKSLYHNGGRLAFGPDGYLYATTGDGQQSDLAQDRDSLNGKVLRMTTAGKPAPGNPFGTLVYSYGHRNPQGIAWDSQGRLWEAEFGNNTYDELNLIKPGLDYGWPTCEGACGVSGMTNPKATWPVNTASPSAIAIVRNVVYMAALRGERLWRVPIGSGESVGAATAYYVGAYGRLRTVVAVPGADQLWLSTTNCDNNGDAAPGSDRIFRVTIT